MKKLLIFGGVLAGVFVLLVLAGARMVPQHLVSRTRRFGSPPERVWTALLSIRQLPFDRSDLKNMESALEKDRLPPAIEVFGSPIQIEARTQAPPIKLVVATTEPGLAYSGTWTFELVSEGDVTRLTVTEDAAIGSPAMRFVVGRILGEDVLIEGIFRAIVRKLVEAPRSTGGY